MIFNVLFKYEIGAIAAVEVGVAVGAGVGVGVGIVVQNFFFNYFISI